MTELDIKKLAIAWNMQDESHQLQHQDVMVLEHE